MKITEIKKKYGITNTILTKEMSMVDFSALILRSLGKPILLQINKEYISLLLCIYEQYMYQPEDNIDFYEIRRDGKSTFIEDIGNRKNKPTKITDDLVTSITDEVIGSF